MIYTSKDDQFVDFWGHEALPINPSVVAIATSGGADSTLVLILACEKFDNTNTTIYPLVGDDDDISRASNYDVVVDIVKSVRKIYPSVNIMDPIRYEYTKNMTENIPKIKRANVKRDTGSDILLVGATLQPPHLKMASGRIPGFIKEVSKDLFCNLTIYAPLYNVNKLFVINQYKTLKLLSILKKTVSCSNVMKEDPQACRKCIWCEERRWALNNNGLVVNDYMD